MALIVGNYLEDKFFYGDTCQYIEDEGKKPEVARKGQRNFDKVKLPIRRGQSFNSSAEGIFIPMHVPIRAAGGTSRPKREFEKEIDWRIEITNVREFLGMSQNEFAKACHVSAGTIHALEPVPEKEPSAAVGNKIKAFIEIVEFIKDHFRGKKYSVRSFLQSELTVLGGLSVKDFLINGDEFSIDDLKGVLYRMFR